MSSVSCVRQALSASEGQPLPLLLGSWCVERSGRPAWEDGRCRCCLRCWMCALQAVVRVGAWGHGGEQPYSCELVPSMILGPHKLGRDRRVVLSTRYDTPSRHHTELLPWYITDSRQEQARARQRSSHSISTGEATAPIMNKTIRSVCVRQSVCQSRCFMC